MRAQLQIGSRLSWVIAWLLALGGAVVALAWPTGLMWWIGLVLVMPLACLAVWRQDQKGYVDDFSGVGDGGPWGPPPA